MHLVQFREEGHATFSFDNCQCNWQFYGPATMLARAESIWPNFKSDGKFFLPLSYIFPIKVGRRSFALRVQLSVDKLYPFITLGISRPHFSYRKL